MSEIRPYNVFVSGNHDAVKKLVAQGGYRSSRSGTTTKVRVMALSTAQARHRIIDLVQGIGKIDRVREA